LNVIGCPRAISARRTRPCTAPRKKGLNNVRKHAEAEHVWLTLDFSDEKLVRLSVRD
jgi:hypothetical protein